MMMKSSDGKLLKSVSRSFYLSIRFLPAPMREPVALGYLLARLTDTIADAPGIPLDQRLASLESIRVAVCDGGVGKGIKVDASLSHPGERELVSRREHLLKWLGEVDAPNREHLREVILTIIHGQEWDITYFKPDRFTACASEDDLLRYTYWVAGSVGEFWTKAAYTNLGSRFAEPGEASELLVRGRNLGQALQLTNILRDLHEDLPAGRCYLPADELLATGWDGESRPDPRQLDPVFTRWLGMCRDKLENADPYIAKIRDFRIRLCTRLPMTLAEKTTDLIEKAGVGLVTTEKVRIPRSDVWKALLRGLFP